MSEIRLKCDRCEEFNIDSENMIFCLKCHDEMFKKLIEEFIKDLKTLVDTKEWWRKLDLIEKWEQKRKTEDEDD